MPNYRADQMLSLLLNTVKARDEEDDPMLLDENTVQDVFQPISEKLSLSDVVTTAAYDPSTFAWGGAKTLLTPSFARSGTAIVPTTGASVQANEPRYVSGKYGFGVMVEEGTTNLVPNTNGRPNTMTPAGTTPPTVVLDTTAGNPFGTEAWKVTFPAGASTGYGGCRVVSDNWAIAANSVYSQTVWFKGDVSSLYVYHTGILGLTRMQSTGRMLNGWTEYATDNYATSSAIPGGSVDYLTIFVNNSLATPTTIWIAASQVEQKAYHTTFANGTRSAETLTLPTMGLSPTQGTVEMWVYVNSVARRQGAYTEIFYVQASGGGYMTLVHVNNTAFWRLLIYDGTTAKLADVADSYTPDGWHHVAVRWSTTTATIAIDGTIRGTMSAPPPITWGSSIYVGGGGQFGYVNTYFDEIHVSTIARSDAEILAHATANAPIVADDNTLALVHFDGTLQGDTLAVNAGWDWNGGAKWNAS